MTLTALSDGVTGDAVIDGEYRYRLDRCWGWPSGPALTWVMINPSKADGRWNDNTGRRIVHFSRRPGSFARLIVVNLFALITPYPRELSIAADPIGPSNDEHIERAIGEGLQTVVAWGGGAGLYPDRVRAVEAMLPPDTLCLGRTKTGHPRHPLYLRNDAPWEVYR